MKHTDKAPETVPHAREMLGDDSTQLFLNQLLLALVVKNGGTHSLSVDEVNATGGYMMNLAVSEDQKVFTLVAKKKH